MCGIIGVFSESINEYIPYEVFEGLMSLQHRGQDSVGIATDYCIIKRNGLVKYAFQNDDLSQLSCKSCIGHVRYATNGIANNIQPLYMSLPSRITLCHNGNIINTESITYILKHHFDIDVSTKSDTELILALFCAKLYSLIKEDKSELNAKIITTVTDYLQELLEGSFCLIIIIQRYGMIVLRDKNGIRPLILGKRNNNYMIASESASLNILNYDILRDVHPGETIIFSEKDNSVLYHTVKDTVLSPCLFEYLYFARADSEIDGISVHNARIRIGQTLGEKMLSKWDCEQIDVIVPVPDTSITFANGISDIIKKPLREGFIKNRYIDRTFIMKNNRMIQQNIKRKLSGIRDVFNEKNVLIVDDSIVRGNTSKHIISIAREYGANNIYFASCSPIVKETNQYGIYIPTRKELISFERNLDEIKRTINVDFLIYHDLPTISNELKKMNPKIDNFETSMFSD